MSGTDPPPRAVIDADIIFSRVLHDLMGRAAQRMRLFNPVWTRELLAEAKQALMQRKGLAEDVAQRWVEYLSRNFPNGETSIEEALRAAELDNLTNDPNDRHVCALAIASGADYLFTHDRGYLADRLADHGIKVTGPGHVPRRRLQESAAGDARTSRTSGEPLGRRQTSRGAARRTGASRSCDPR